MFKPLPDSDYSLGKQPSTEGEKKKEEKFQRGERKKNSNDFRIFISTK